MGRFVKEVEQLEFHRAVAVTRIVLAQFVHLSLEHVIIDLEMAQQTFLHIHTLDGVGHVDLAWLE